MLLIYQLKPVGAVNNWLLAHLHMCFNVLLCRRYVYLWRQLLSMVAIEIKLAYSYSVTHSNNQFCRNCNYYEFETVQHCGGTTTVSLKTGRAVGQQQLVWKRSGEVLWELMRTMPCRDAFCCFPTMLLKICVSQGLPSPRDKPQSHCSHCEHRALPVWLSSSWGLLRLLCTGSFSD